MFCRRLVSSWTLRRHGSTTWTRRPFAAKSELPTESAPRIALAFPGQGTQHVGMGLELLAEYPTLSHTLEEAEETLGFRLGSLMAEGPQVRKDSESL